MTNTAYPDSYYAASANRTPLLPVREGVAETYVCVVGACYSGLSTALFLLEHGFKVTVLEAVKVGFGAPGRNGGKIVNSYSRDIDAVENSVSIEKAKLIGEMAFEGGRIIRDRVARYGIQCDLKDGYLIAAFSRKQINHLQAQQRLWERYGYEHLELLDGDAIRHVVACDNY